MLGALTGLVGGGVSTSVSSKSGDANAGGYDGSFQYNGAFQVGGSGSQSQTQTAAQEKTTTPAVSSGSQALVYAALGIAIAAILVSTLAGARRS